MSDFIEVRFRGSNEEIHDQWVKQRLKGVGGSEAAAIMGLSKWKSPLDVWLEKTGREEPSDLSDVAAVEWGSILEDVVARHFAERHPGWTVRRKNAMCISKLRPWAFADVDRILIDDEGRHGVLEIKTAGEYMRDDWAETPPTYYIPQPTHYLSVLGDDYEFFEVAVLIGGRDYRDSIDYPAYHFERDQDDIDAVEKAVDTFWRDYVLGDVMPELIGSSSETDALTRMSSPAIDEIGYIDEETQENVDRYVSICADIKQAEQEKREVGNAIKAAIGEDTGIENDLYKVTWVRSMSKVTDYKKMAADHPEIDMSDYTTEKPKDGGLRVKEK